MGHPHHFEPARPLLLFIRLRTSAGTLLADAKYRDRPKCAAAKRVLGHAPANSRRSLAADDQKSY